MLNVPNLLTVARILTIPAFLILLTSGRPGLALAVFVAGGVTDALDGAIARSPTPRPSSAPSSTRSPTSSSC